MKKIETPIKDLFVIEPQVFKDDRGYFFESFNHTKFEQLGIMPHFIQDNQSYSSYGVVRGLHYQLNPNAQSKLVRVLKGKIYDVAVDLRKGSPTFGKWHGVELSDENFCQLYIPKGFAHGFSVLSEKALVLYKCDDYWNKDAERGIIYNDKNLNIDWKIPKDKMILSGKDQIYPEFAKAEMNF
jgi:dTDP-4-dehydrorhamnose 3,5-epimerase